jgi:Putative oxalocrotonate tautomerase enzyme
LLKNDGESPDEETRISHLVVVRADLYQTLPKFYVGVVFQDVPKGSFYIGGEPVNNFVRIWIDHIARTLPTPEAKAYWVKISNEAIAPFVKDRGYDLEFHIDETPFDLRSIQGLKPFLDDPFVGQDRNPLGSEEASLSLLNEGGVSRNLALRFDARLGIDQCVRPSLSGPETSP